jgi:hypothetical protein
MPKILNDFNDGTGVDDSPCTGSTEQVTTFDYSGVAVPDSIPDPPHNLGMETPCDGHDS